MNYYTGIINNFNNIDPEGMLQTNGITISVNNDAVNYAKGNTEGIIEIPNRIWSSLISNVTFPDRSFFNRLFINVSGVVNEQTLNVQDKIIDITTNGTRTVTPDVGYQGLGEVTINTNVPSGVNNQNKTVTIRSNGNSAVEYDSGYSGLGKVDIIVDVPSDINNQNKSLVVNSNGSQNVLPDQGYSGIGELSLSVNVPQPSIQDNKILFVEAGKEARQVIVEPDSGYDALDKVTLNVASPTLARDQNILNITSNGTYNLPSLGDSVVLGFADSCTVKVNVDIIKIRYISLSSSATASGKVDLLNVVFSGPGLTSYSIPPGRTVLLATVNNESKVIGFRCIGNRTGASENFVANFTNDVLVTEINYDIGDRVYLKDENEQVIMSVGVHEDYEDGKYYYKTDYSAFNPEIMNFMYNN